MLDNKKIDDLHQQVTSELIRWTRTGGSGQLSDRLKSLLDQYYVEVHADHGTPEDWIERRKIVMQGLIIDVIWALEEWQWRRIKRHIDDFTTI